MFEIEKGINIPQEFITKPEKYPWKSMEIGDSFFVPNAVRQTVCMAASQAGRRYLGKKFLTRSVDGGVRVWRIK